MREQARGGAGSGILTFIAIYALWLLSGVLALAVCISWQTTLQRLYVVFGFDKYGFAAFTYTVMIGLLLGWLVFVVVAEGLYRRAAEEGRLWRRAAWVIGWLVALVALAMLVGRLV